MVVLRTRWPALGSPSTGSQTSSSPLSSPSVCSRHCRSPHTHPTHTRHPFSPPPPSHPFPTPFPPRPTPLPYSTPVFPLHPSLRCPRPLRLPHLHRPHFLLRLVYVQLCARDQGPLHCRGDQRVREVLTSPAGSPSGAAPAGSTAGGSQGNHIFRAALRLWAPTACFVPGGAAVESAEKSPRQAAGGEHRYSCKCTVGLALEAGRGGGRRGSIRALHERALCVGLFELSVLLFLHVGTITFTAPSQLRIFSKCIHESESAPLVLLEL